MVASRGFGLRAAKLVASAGRSFGVVAMSCFASAIVCASAFGTDWLEFCVRNEKICERERMVGRSADGCSVISTK